MAIRVSRSIDDCRRVHRLATGLAALVSRRGGPWQRLATRQETDVHGQRIRSAACGFEWIDCHDAEHSVLAWLRWGRDGGFVVIAANFTPQPQIGYRLGVPLAGEYIEVLNTDSTFYGGSNLGNEGTLQAASGEWMRRPANIEVTIPPLGMIILQAAGTA